MKNILSVIFFAINSTFISAQITLSIEGTVVNNKEPGTWSGVIVPRCQPTKFAYQNNTITSINTGGYMLQAGDEGPTSDNNDLDGSVITGNKFNWNGSNNPAVITHGLFTGYNKNCMVKYNYLNNAPYGIVFKSGTDDGINMTFTSGGCAYNICKNEKYAIRIKGMNGVNVYNNTFYSGDGLGWNLLLITSNGDRVIPAPSTDSRLFNNIFYSTIQIPMINIESGCLTNFKSDYNIFWCEAGKPTFVINGVTKTFCQWQALGYDTHSIVINPDFIDYTDFVPRVRLDYGTNLGSKWQTGLSIDAIWDGTDPEMTDQNGTWQVGARIYSSEKEIITGIPGSLVKSEPLQIIVTCNEIKINLTDEFISWKAGLYNFEGSLVSSKILESNVTIFDISSDHSGIYFVVLSKGENRRVAKVIKP